MNTEMNQRTLLKPARTLVIGDIHGCLDALTTLSEVAKFSADDQIIFLGDYIDRGSQSQEVIDWIIEKSQTLHIITLKGNHEIMMQDAYTSVYDFQLWISNGGIQTLMSFDCDLKQVPLKYWNFMTQCSLYHESDKHIFVHGGPDPDLPLSEQDSQTLCWLRFNKLQSHQSKKVVICGHTPQRNHVPGILPHAVCIDTHAVNTKGYLTCLDVLTGNYWQANQAKKSRLNKIEMPTNA